MQLGSISANVLYNILVATFEKGTEEDHQNDWGGGGRWTFSRKKKLEHLGLFCLKKSLLKMEGMTEVYSIMCGREETFLPVSEQWAQ